MSVQDEVADTKLMLMGHRFYEPSLGRFWKFRNKAGTEITWDRGLRSSLYNETARPHWTIRQANQFFDARGNPRAKLSGPAHIRSGGRGEGNTFTVRKGESFPENFPNPPIGNDGFMEILPD
jgi:hypothetical protein